MSASIDHAALLIDQNRPRDAEKILHHVLASDPDDATALTLLGMCKVDMELYGEAIKLAGKAVGLAPEYSYGHIVMAQALAGQKKMAQAIAAAKEAIRLSPEEDHHHGALAAIYGENSQWKEALESAEIGLRIDPESVQCNNLRALALVQLGRNNDAAEAMEVTMRRDPENAFTHANMGWNHLNRGDYKPAFTSFREALRLDPNMEFAREGLLQALRATSAVYRPILKFFLFMEKLTTAQQWILILGLIFGSRALRVLGQQYPAARPFVMPVIALYFLFLYLTWTAPVLHDVFLRFHPMGKLALNKEQKLAASIAGTLLVLAIASFVWTFAASWLPPLFFGILCLLEIVLVGGSFNASKNKRRFLVGYSIVTFLVGVAGVLLFPKGTLLLLVALLLVVAFTWIKMLMKA